MKRKTKRKPITERAWGVAAWNYIGLVDSGQLMVFTQQEDAKRRAEQFATYAPEGANVRVIRVEIREVTRKARKA